MDDVLLYCLEEGTEELHSLKVQSDLNRLFCIFLPIFLFPTWNGRDKTTFLQTLASSSAVHDLLSALQYLAQVTSNYW